ncbi:MAG: LLM class flavin-dependent oxidoreductase [Propionibacterium sp.]|nr:LLM class flavin-dependent oxidoreductase [Propionibacterium sp.]
MTLNIGIALSPTWLRQGAWRRDDSRVEEMFTLAPYRELAHQAEEAALDFLFCPEAGYLRPETIDKAPGFATLDSYTLVAALAATTTRIGLVPTIQTVYAHPFPVARSLASLQQISGGRAGWNVVTALGGEENYGLANPPGSAERYARAAEFVSVVTSLWDSFPAEAFVADRASGVFADATRVRSIDFEGEHFQIAGPMALPAHPAGRLPLLQAGASPSGIAFAGSVADAVFGATPELEAAREQRTALREAAVAAGRDAGGIRFLPGLNLVLAATRGEAQDLAEASEVDTPLHWSVIGTPADAADAIEARAAAGAIDGFIALPGGSRKSIDLFLDQVVPLLRQRGLFRDGYQGGTLREHLGLPG